MKISEVKSEVQSDLIELGARLFKQVNHGLFSSLALLPLKTDLILNLRPDFLDSIEKHLFTFFTKALFVSDTVLDALELLMYLLLHHLFGLFSLANAVSKPVVQVWHVFFQVETQRVDGLARQILFGAYLFFDSVCTVPDHGQ